MMSAFRLCLAVVVTVLCISTEQAASHPHSGKRAPGSCEWRQFQVSDCVANGYVDFQTLHDTGSKQQLCRENKGPYNCLVQHRSECPSIAIFQGRKGQTAANFISAYQNLCTGAAEAERCVAQQRDPAEGCDILQFRQELQTCLNPLEVALRENQMCQPLDEVSSCVEQQAQQYRHCGWMTSCLTRQLHLATTFFRALRVFHYSCPPSAL